MALREYERKRNLAETPEPAPRPRRRREQKKGGPRFVVQEHSARRLHWDLRLEHEGLAPSWAIPKGVPDDPAENHLAVRTEDHPLEYLDFEGEIPAGEYGAGTMRIWDRGTYETEKWREGEVIAVFHGERLRGRYALFRTGKEGKNWMIHRMDPAEVERDPFPDAIEPMRARRGALPRGRWAIELRWQGERAIALCRPGQLRLRSAGLEDLTRRYPEVRRLSRELGTREAVLDGVLVAFDGELPSAERLRKRREAGSESSVRRLAKSDPVTYVVFDLLYLDGADLTAEPYRRRRELLDGLELNGEAWQTPSYSTGKARQLLEAARSRGLPGLVLKRFASAYSPGKRSEDWREVRA
jgi:bifunctional non-homologous end joining protein LigD